MSTHDLVVRGATVVDGTGAPGFEADVAIDGDRIVIVGAVSGSGAEELDGRGLVLAPGWIDTHTHLDANQFWDPYLTPCSRYGVTSVVIANCGYALALADVNELGLAETAKLGADQDPPNGRPARHRRRHRFLQLTDLAKCATRAALGRSCR